MPESAERLAERRLNVWRLTYALFDTTRVGDGPFYRVGYRDLSIEPILDNETNPDMVGVSKDWFAVIEISCSPNKEFGKVREYAHGKLTEPLKRRLGGQPRRPSGAPFFITTEVGIQSFPPELNHIKVSNPIETNLARVDDTSLRAELEKWEGFQGPVSNYGLRAVPESEQEELKLVVAGILRKAMLDGEPVDPSKFADDVLGELAPSVLPKARTRLVTKLESVLKLAAGSLPGIRWDEKRRQLQVEKVESAQSRVAFNKAVMAWLKLRPIETYSHLPEDDEKLAG